MKLGISQTAYQRMESGNSEKMDVDTIIEISKILETDPVDLIFSGERQIFLNCNQSGNYHPIYNNVPRTF